MASISSLGIGSGIDANTIVSQLVELERARLTPLQTKAKTLTTQISAISEIKSRVEKLQDKLKVLSAESTWSTSTKVASSNPTAISATTSANAVNGTYSIEVTQLAVAESVTSGRFNNGHTFSAGSLDISVGGATRSVSVADGASLQDVARAINDGNLGVTASVMSDGVGQRLIVTSKETGESGSFQIASTTLPELSHDGTAGSSLASGGSHQAFANAVVKINGIEIESSTNNFDSNIQGVSFVAQQIGTSVLTVSTDTEKLKTLITEFVEAYNSVNSYLKNATKFENDVAGTFQGDSTILSLQNALRKVVSAGASVPGNAYSRLSDLGIELKSGGNLEFTNSSKLDAAISGNVAELGKFFAFGEVGFADNVYSYTKAVLDFEGLIANKTNALNTAVKRNQKEQDRVEDRALSVQQRLIAQYTALDAKMASMSALSSYVEQQVSQWNKSNG